MESAKRGFRGIFRSFSHKGVETSFIVPRADSDAEIIVIIDSVMYRIASDLQPQSVHKRPAKK